MRQVTCAVEGRTDDPVATKLLHAVGLSAGVPIVKGGKTSLDPRLPDYNQAARHMPWLVIRDLDHDDQSECIPGLVHRLLGGIPSAGMCFRLAVREVEAWLMADQKNFARFFGIRLGKMPTSFDGLNDPKQTLLNLCRMSNKASIREGMVPRPGSGRSVGPRYTALVREFVADSWNPVVARTSSPSLDRALECLGRLRQHVDAGRF